MRWGLTEQLSCFKVFVLFYDLLECVIPLLQNEMVKMQINVVKINFKSKIFTENKSI